MCHGVSEWVSVCHSVWLQSHGGGFVGARPGWVRGTDLLMVCAFQNESSVIQAGIRDPQRTVSQGSRKVFGRLRQEDYVEVSLRSTSNHLTTSAPAAVPIANQGKGTRFPPAIMGPMVQPGIAGRGGHPKYFHGFPPRAPQKPILGFSYKEHLPGGRGQP